MTTWEAPRFCGGRWKILVTGLNTWQVVRLLGHEVVEEGAFIDNQGMAYFTVSDEAMEAHDLYECLWWLTDDILEKPVLLDGMWQNAIAAALMQPEPEDEETEDWWEE